MAESDVTQSSISLLLGELGREASKDVSSRDARRIEYVKSLNSQAYRLNLMIDDPRGWKKFLRELSPSTFYSKFGVMHEEFWDWYWKLTKLRFYDLPLDGEQLSFASFLGRSNAKSSMSEWAAITEGAFGLDGYVLYISATQDSANSHVNDIRTHIEKENFGNLFPTLSNPRIGSFGNQYGWRQDFLMTESGWAIRPVGLKTGVRGLKEGDLRPSLIILDDIDDINDSLAEVQSKIQVISRSVLPSGTQNTINILAQNLIHENSFANQVYTGKTDIFSNAKISFYPTFSVLNLETKINEEGRTTHTIKEPTIPVWDAFNIQSAQIFLDKVGLEAFYAEYQHDFSMDKQKKVIPEYADYPVHVISWGQFQKKFNSPCIPEHWDKGVGLDIGYSEKHLSAWSFLAVSAQNSVLPNAHFLYRGMTFKNVSILDQAEAVINRIKEEQLRQKYQLTYNELSKFYTVEVMSHEKLGEKKILNDDYDFNFSPCKKEKEAGIPEWRNILRVDKSQPHPFHNDTFNPKTGEFALGRPNMFYIVMDGEETNPTGDYGLKTHREEVANWKRRKVTLSISGLSADQPEKIADDTADSVKIVLAEKRLQSKPLTRDEKLEQFMPKNLRRGEIEKSIGTAKYAEELIKRAMKSRQFEEKQKQEGLKLAKVLNLGNIPVDGLEIVRKEDMDTWGKPDKEDWEAEDNDGIEKLFYY